jgi:uncharacterized protein
MPASPEKSHRCDPGSFTLSRVERSWHPGATFTRGARYSLVREPAGSTTQPAEWTILRPSGRDTERIIIVSTPERPFFSTLGRAESEAILARNNVGRLAYARANRVDIEPVHYVFSDGWIYGRTSAGKKIEMVGYSWWPVAFEVDEITALFEWKSVVVHGGFYTLRRDGGPAETVEWERAVELLRTLIPQTFTEDDPTPFRDIVFRIAVQEISGRMAAPSGEEPEGS